MSFLRLGLGPPLIGIQTAVFVETRESPHQAAEMYICNLFVAYFVFSPICKQSNFLKLFFVDTNTLNYDVHIYGFFGLIPWTCKGCQRF